MSLEQPHVNDVGGTPAFARSRTRGDLTFLRHAVRNQRRIGAISPTSTSAARRMAALIAPVPGWIVVELGAGTGAISAAIGPRLGQGSRHIAVELEPGLLGPLRYTAPWAERVLGDARNLSGLLKDVGVSEADVVLSSLPWGNFEPDLQQHILGEITESLTTSGLFATIVYRPTRMTRMTHSSRAFRRALRTSFDEVSISTTLWANLPPARLYICHTPTSRRYRP